MKKLGKAEVKNTLLKITQLLFNNLVQFQKKILHFVLPFI